MAGLCLFAESRTVVRVDLAAERLADALSRGFQIVKHPDRVLRHADHRTWAHRTTRLKSPSIPASPHGRSRAVI